MSRFQILCVTMFQDDFSKLKEMNVHSDIIYANQCDRNADETIEFDGHKARMISTTTRGVGINRNFTLQYADAEICLLGDDDILYSDDVEEKVVREFDAHPDADVIFFHLNSSDASRSVKKPEKTVRLGKRARLPWGGAHIAFRLSSVRKANVWFSTLFGGGCPFPSGEDSIWLIEARRKGLIFYSSKESIGDVDMSNSSWYTGADERYYRGKGAFYMVVHPKTRFLWMLYFAWRTRKKAKIGYLERLKLMRCGVEDYRNYRG